MKAFARPDGGALTTIDLNAAVESTLTIARNEYRYVADVRTDLGPLPPVMCYASEINQVILDIRLAMCAAGGVVNDAGQAQSSSLSRKSLLITLNDRRPPSVADACSVSGRTTTPSLRCLVPGYVPRAASSHASSE
jgi:hypothetical protein